MSKTGRTLALFAVLALLVLGCSADPPCVVGSQGWCQNEMAALAVHTIMGPGADQVQPAIIAVVAEGFTVDTTRFSGVTVSALKPDGVTEFATSHSSETLVIISDVHVTNEIRSGGEVAQGSATATVYSGGRVVKTQTVRGRLVGATWIATTGN